MGALRVRPADTMHCTVSHRVRRRTLRSLEEIVVGYGRGFVVSPLGDHSVISMNGCATKKRAYHDEFLLFRPCRKVYDGGLARNGDVSFVSSLPERR